MEVTEITKILVGLERLKRKTHRSFLYDTVGGSDIVQVMYVPLDSIAVELATLRPSSEPDTVDMTTIIGRDASGKAVAHTSTKLPLEFALNALGQLVRLTSLNVKKKEVNENGRR